MGFLRRLLRRAELIPPESFVPDSFPFAGEIRLYHWEYERIRTGWWNVTVASPAEWAAKVAEMQEGIRRNFGVYRTKDGRLLPRWNARAWGGLQKWLLVERR